MLVKVMEILAKKSPKHNNYIRFYKPPGSGEFSPLGSSRRPNLFNNSISARPSPSVGISLLGI